MKISALTLVPILALLSSSVACAQILYSQNFDYVLYNGQASINGDGQNSDPLNIAFGTTAANELTAGWAAYTNAVVDKNSSNAPNSISDRQSPNGATSGPDQYGFLVLSGAATGTIAATQALTPINLANYSSLTFNWAQGDSNANDTLNLAIQLNNNQWYVSTTAVSTSAQGAGSPGFGVSPGSLGTFETLAFNSAPSNWNLLTFTPGTTTVASIVTLGSAPVSALTGNITGAGLYVSAGGNGSNDRIDEFQISGTAVAAPEPSTRTLLLGCLLVLIVTARLNRSGSTNLVR